MKQLSFFCVLFLAAISQAGAVDLPDANGSMTLTGWTVAGTDAPPQINRDSITLPVGAQISRTFTGGAVIAHLVTRPAFKETSNDWPILGLGPVALVFRLEEGTGRLVLASADGSLNPISVQLPLDSAGRSQQAIDLFFAYDPSRGLTVVAVDGRVWSFRQMTGPSAVEALIAAGEDQPWELAGLDVEVFASDSTQSAKQLANPSRSGLEAKARPLSDQVKSLLVRPPAIPFTSINPAAKGGAAVKPARKATLEIFTPPAYRSFGAAAVRATVQQAGK